MTDPNKKKKLFQHILVAIDASAHTEGGLETAVYLADHLGSRLKGLFIRSPELHHICRLTFLSEVSELTGEIRPLPEQFMEQQLSQAEKRIQHKVQFAEFTSHITCTWTSVVGSVSDQVLAAADNTDLIVLSQTGQSITRFTKLADTVRAISDRSGKPILVAGKSMSPPNGIILLYDGSRESRKGLETALDLAESVQLPLSIMVLLNNYDDPRRTLNLLEEKVKDTGVPVSLLVLRNLRIWDLVHGLNRLPSGFLIIPEGISLGQNKKPEYLLDLVKKHSFLFIN